jgi:gamma-glutamylcyclotransferase (GGCT)/AIG2-like uncharacterized protein YtfP
MTTVDWTMDYEKYLQAKENVDDRSIHPKLWGKFEAYLHYALTRKVAEEVAPSTVQLIDVGAGLGSLLFRLLAHWQRPEVQRSLSACRRGVQYWAVDHKAGLLRALLQRLETAVAYDSSPWSLEQLEIDVADDSRLVCHSTELSGSGIGSELHRARDQLFDAPQLRGPQQTMKEKSWAKKSNIDATCRDDVSGRGSLSASLFSVNRDHIEVQHTKQMDCFAGTARKGSDPKTQNPHECMDAANTPSSTPDIMRSLPPPMNQRTWTTAPGSGRSSLRIIGSALIVPKGQHEGFPIKVRCLQGDALDFCAERPSSTDVLWASSFFDLLLGNTDQPDTAHDDLQKLRKSLPVFLEALKPGGLFYFPLHYDGMTYWEPSFADGSAEAEAERTVLAAFHQSMGRKCHGRSGQALLHILQRLAAIDPGQCTVGIRMASRAETDKRKEASSGTGGCQQMNDSVSGRCLHSVSADTDSSLSVSEEPRELLRPQLLAMAPSTWFVQPLAGLCYLPVSDAYFLECILKFIGGAAWIHASTLEERMQTEYWFRCRLAHLKENILTYVAHHIDLMGVMERSESRRYGASDFEMASQIDPKGIRTCVNLLHSSMPGISRFGSKMEPSGVFCYGTLQSAKVLETILGRVPRSLPAVLEGYQVHGVLGESYPAVTPLREAGIAQNASVSGLFLIGLTAEELRRLDAYEGPQYRKLVDRILLVPYSLSVDAYVYVWNASANDLFTLPEGRWDIHDWIRRHEKAFCADCAEWVSTLTKKTTNHP